MLAGGSVCTWRGAVPEPMVDLGGIADWSGSTPWIV